MEQVFGYIIGLGAAVMMPIIFTILGVCIGIKFSKALKSGLLVGVGFVGLSVVTALLTSSLGPALSQVVEIYGLQLKVFDMGWPAAAAVAYNTSVGAFIIPVCLGVNLLMLLTKNDPYSQYRPLELLAFRIYRRSRLFCQRQYLVGLLRRYHLLHHYPDYGRLYRRQIPGVLRQDGGYLHSPAFLRRFRSICRSHQ